MPCSAYSHNSHIVVRMALGTRLFVASGTRFGFGRLPGKHFNCRNALEFWIGASAGKAVRKA